jgi:hypothetical protein
MTTKTEEKKAPNSVYDAEYFKTGDTYDYAKWGGYFITISHEQLKADAKQVDINHPLIRPRLDDRLAIMKNMSLYRVALYLPEEPLYKFLSWLTCTTVLCIHCAGHNVILINNPPCF